MVCYHYLILCYHHLLQLKWGPENISGQRIIYHICHIIDCCPRSGNCLIKVLIMACRDVWNTWHEGLRAPQNPTAKPEGFVATGGPRAMYFTHHGKPWLKPIIARPLGKIWYKTVVTLHKWSQQRRQSTTAIDDRTSLGLAVLGKRQHP